MKKFETEQIDKKLIIPYNVVEFDAIVDEWTEQIKLLERKKKLEKIKKKHK